MIFYVDHTLLLIWLGKSLTSACELVVLRSAFCCQPLTLSGLLRPETRRVFKVKVDLIESILRSETGTADVFAARWFAPGADVSACHVLTLKVSCIHIFLCNQFNVSSFFIHCVSPCIILSLVSSNSRFCLEWQLC